jgi:methyltransferase (TIGR00027 family)
VSFSARAEESRRSDRLFDDPYAEAFVAAAPGAFLEERATSGELASMGTVVYFHDDYLTAATAAACRQVVLLAAGLDPRAFRSGWLGPTARCG